MSRRIEYTAGEQVGEYGFIFICDSNEPYISSSGNKYRQAYFLCPVCGKQTLCLIQEVKAGKRSCGCITSQLKAQGGIKAGKDITEQRFGKLVAKYYKNIRTKNGRSKRLWYCECDCGGNTWTTVDSLISGHTQSCGCLKTERSREIHTKDITGITSGLLTAQYNTNKQDAQGNFLWYCTCECGGHKEVPASRLISQTVLSCGCLSSRGESKIAEILDILEIKYKRQKTFNQCINPITHSKLKFDFYLPDYNCCIEYDGKQHFVEKGTWAEKENIENIILRDKIKTDYCLNNGLILIRIPYTDYELVDKNYLLNRILLEKGEE